MIQLEDGNIVMDTRRLKSEPEDLSLREDGEVGVVRLADNRQLEFIHFRGATSYSNKHFTTQCSILKFVFYLYQERNLFFFKSYINVICPLDFETKKRGKK